MLYVPLRAISQRETNISARVKQIPTHRDHGNMIYTNHPLLQIAYLVQVHLEDQVQQDHHYYQEYQVVKEKN
jgi:uncharacterized protein (DUF3084 family)